MTCRDRYASLTLVAHDLYAASPPSSDCLSGLPALLGTSALFACLPALYAKSFTNKLRRLVALACYIAHHPGCVGGAALCGCHGATPFGRRLLLGKTPLSTYPILNTRPYLASQLWHLSRLAVRLQLPVANQLHILYRDTLAAKPDFVPPGLKLHLRFCGTNCRVLTLQVGFESHLDVVAAGHPAMHKTMSSYWLEPRYAIMPIFTCNLDLRS